MIKSDGNVLGVTAAVEAAKPEVLKNETSLEIVTKVRHADIFIDGKLAGRHSVKINTSIRKI